jgi:hypothetical protein
LELKLNAAYVDKLGAVRAIGRSTSRAHTHRIALGDGCLPTELWTTACGWRFGSIAHRRMDVSAVDCASCLKFYGTAQPCDLDRSDE